MQPFSVSKEVWISPACFFMAVTIFLGNSGKNILVLRNSWSIVDVKQIVDSDVGIADVEGSLPDDV